MTDLDERKTALIVSAKAAFRSAQTFLTWKQRVEAIARMNVASKLAKEGMLKSMNRKKWHFFVRDTEADTEQL